LPSSFPPEPILSIFKSFEFVREGRERGLAALNEELNDYGNEAFNSTGRPTRYLEDPIVSFPWSS
jgi:hypothetical protein